MIDCIESSIAVFKAIASMAGLDALFVRTF